MMARTFFFELDSSALKIENCCKLQICSLTESSAQLIIES